MHIALINSRQDPGGVTIRRHLLDQPLGLLQLCINIESGADIIDIGCVANKPYPERIKEIVNLIRNNFNVLISIDSMEKTEILSAVDEGVDLRVNIDGKLYGPTDYEKII